MDTIDNTQKIDKELKRILFNLFYDGDSESEAIDYIKRCYSQTPNRKTIEAAIKAFEQSGKSIIEGNI